jgi:hypothetical protein
MKDRKELTNREREAAKIFSKDSAEFADLFERPEGISVKKWRVHLEASRRLAAMGGTMPDLEDIRRLRVDDL